MEIVKDELCSDWCISCLIFAYSTFWSAEVIRRKCDHGFPIIRFTLIETAKLTRGRCFPFIDKRVGRIMGVAIFESFSFSIGSHLFQFR